MTGQLEADILIVGGGGCGLTAAISAAESGATVFLIEKDARLGGHTSMTESMIPAAGTRFQEKAHIDDSPEKMVEDIVRQNGGQCDRSLLHQLCRSSAPMVEWLVDHCGVELDVVTDFLYPGQSVHRMHATPNRTGRELTDRLIEVASETRDLFIFNKKAVKHLFPKEDTAILVEVGEESEIVTAKKVILASGGFGGNRKMVEMNIPEASGMLYMGSSNHNGDTIRFGEKFGAGLAYLDAYQAHSAISSIGNLISWETMLNGGIMINVFGKRFGNETMSYSSFASLLCSQPQQTAHEIFDEAIYRLMFDHYERFRETATAGGITRCTSLAEISQATNIEERAIRETLGTYNKEIYPIPDEFGRSSGKRLDPPFYVAKVRPALFHTQGGLVVNENGQVVKQDNQTIASLYAGGGAAAGFSGHGGSGYSTGNGLFSAFVYGWLAGRHASKGFARG